MLPNHDFSTSTAAAAQPVIFAGALPKTAPKPPADPVAPADPLPTISEFESVGRTTVWDVPFDLVTRHQAVDQIARLIQLGNPSYVITANVNYVMLHHQQTELQAVTEQAALILADGQPIVWRSLLNAERLPARVAGSELIYDLAARASQHGWGIYFLGGEPGVAQICADKLRQRYPGLRIAGVESPPFRPLTAEEQQAQDKRIQQSGAQILLVAFGQPKGELWIHRNYQRLGVPVSIQLGASFDFVAGTAQRAPRFLRRSGLEWAHRMCCDPRRLVRRYAANALFLGQALCQDWVRQVQRWGMDIK
jgi:N-acetylglucosaminyldiphosphoundecaprenol N-acetyl-beta-D-mannosaminyltransferase